MKNLFLYNFRNTVYVKIKGKNIERFLKRIISLNIEIYSLKYIKYNEIIINIDKKNYEKINEIKTIYEMEIVGVSGIDKLKILLKKNKYIIIAVIISLILIFYLSNTIFKVEVVHNNPDIRKLLISELEENDMKIYSYKKNYDEIQNVKKKILEKYKDKIEWLEIERVGTKYIVRVEERIINGQKEKYVKQDIVAKKDALILKVEAENGEIVKNKNEYVKKGDIVITGSIKLNEEVKNNIMAKGKIYGEVWYKVTVEYPLNYKEEVLTGKNKSTYAIKILSNTFNLFDFKKYKNKKVEESYVLKHVFLPIGIIKQKQYEIKKVEQTLTSEQAIEKAEIEARKKIQSKLNDNEYIINTKKLKVEQNDSKIVLELFVSVYEDITEYKEIMEQTEETGD